MVIYYTYTWKQKLLFGRNFDNNEITHIGQTFY